MAVLGIDLGTSSVKVAVVRGESILGTGIAHLSVQSPIYGWSEQAPDSWAAATKDAIRSAILDASVDSDSISGIGLSGQMHGAVLLDKSHQCLRPAILWNDNRSVQECEVMNRSVTELGNLAGVLALPGFTAPKILWLKHNEPNVYDQIAHVLLPKDFLALWLTGQIGTDYSDAAGTLWLDQARGCWSEKLCAASATDPNWLPPISHGHDCIGTLTKTASAELGLPQGCRVFAGGGDAATGAVAVGATRPGQSFISLGTSGQLLTVDGSYRPNPEQFVHAFRHTVPNTWYRMAAMLNGARPLDWFAGILGSTAADVVGCAKMAHTDAIPTFLPYLTGERSPLGDPHIRSSFVHLSETTGRNELCAAVVEAVAFCVKDCADSFGTDLNAFGRIPVIGGGSKGDHVLQVLANGTGLAIGRSDAGRGGASLGAARLAQVGIGERTIDDLSQTPKIGMEFDPVHSPALNARYDRFKRTYAALKDIARGEFVI